MATEKRQRQKANRQVKVEHQRREAKQRAVKKRVVFLGSIVALVLIGLFVVYLTGRGEVTDQAAEGSSLTLGTTTTTSDTDSEPAPTTPAPGSSAVSAPPAGASVEGETECPPADGSAERTTSFQNPPPQCIDDTKAYTAEVVTNLGSFTIELDADAAPRTVNNFVVLSRYRYYDGAPFHRIIPDFVVQGGDAVGDPLGTGDPGYSIDDELPEAGAYQVGSVAMANSGPDTNGSQFFVITGDAGVALPASYSLFGTVTDGLDVVAQIEAVETTDDDAPTQPIVIETIRITEN